MCCVMNGYESDSGWLHCTPTFRLKLNLGDGDRADNNIIITNYKPSLLKKNIFVIEKYSKSWLVSIIMRLAKSQSVCPW